MANVSSVYLRTKMLDCFNSKIELVFSFEKQSERWSISLRLSLG